MRDPERIGRICTKLHLVWKYYPDMRLGQFLENYIFGHHISHPDGCIFHIEDDVVEEKLDEMILHGNRGEIIKRNISKGRITGLYKTKR